ncbi:MAG: hypothetical protein WD509_00795 [Candidatus Paceibacterota bacterium]
MKSENALVIFGKELPPRLAQFKSGSTVVFAYKQIRNEVEDAGFKWSPLEELVDPGNIYEARKFVEELSRVSLPDGSRVTKSGVYEGYELWWAHCQNLFLYFTLPHTQYKRLLESLKKYNSIFLYQPPYKSLFLCYLRAYGKEVSVLSESYLSGQKIIPLGVVVQMFITFISIPILIVRRYPVMMFTGDKFEKSKDYDFRMRFLYEELRSRQIHFVEFIRSLEPWRVIIEHALKRRRPIIYSEAVTFSARFISFVTGGSRRVRNKFMFPKPLEGMSSEGYFRLLVTTQYLLTVDEDIWAIRIMKLITRLIGLRASIVTATIERNFHSVLACKLNSIPVTGILHGANTHNYNVYDFMQGFDGEKRLSVDKYGVWSEWWKAYYEKESDAYGKEQLFVSGPMRPLEGVATHQERVSANNSKKKVLFVSEIVAVPAEVMPYLEALTKVEDFDVYIKFRSYGDNFEAWLNNNRPDFLNTFDKKKILKGDMHKAIEICDVIVGSQSTGVIEATLHLKPFVFFRTKKWGDYFSMKSFDSQYSFFAEDSSELEDCIRKSGTIPTDVLKGVRDKFFGDPHKNGSAWVIDQVEDVLQK